MGVSQSTRPSVSKSPQEILTERAEYYFKIGDYFRASNLYNHCLTALVYVEDEEEVRRKLNLCKQLHYLQNKLFYAITKGDNNTIPVSYTHLDVYKRQILFRVSKKFGFVNTSKKAPKLSSLAI